MNMPEILAHFESKPHVAAGSVANLTVDKNIEGEPVQDRAGFFSWSVGYLELRGNSAETRRQGFKADAGVEGAITLAYYNGSEPLPGVTTSEFAQWMHAAYVADPEAYPGLIIHHKDEVGEWAFISYLVEGAQAQFRVRNGQAPVACTFDYASLEHVVPIDGYRG